MSMPELSKEPLLVSTLERLSARQRILTWNPLRELAVYEVGAFAGAIMSFFVGDRLGRLKMMWIGAIWMIVGTVIGVTAFKGHFAFGQFIIARVVSGVGTGFLTATIPSWVAECSKAKNRGFLICSEASTVAVGTVIAYWINYG